MKAIYQVAGISKQACQQYRIRQLHKGVAAFKFFDQADRIRKDHPRAGCRKMALDLCCSGWGRDKTEQLLLSNGYRLQYPRNYARTTYSQQHLLYPNLIEGLELTGINQLVQTDITYFRVRERFYYIVFLIDVYSRRIVGYAVNKTLEAQGNIKALRMMFNTRQDRCLTSLIHHSDRGSQYIDTVYRKMLTDKGIIISMCKEAWQNAYTERVNRTIKEEYLNEWKIENYQELTRSVAKAVKHYNNKRKHQALGYISPIDFEKQPDRVTMKLYKSSENPTQNGWVDSRK